MEDMKKYPMVYPTTKTWKLYFEGKDILESLDVFDTTYYLSERRATRFGIRCAALTVRLHLLETGKPQPCLKSLMIPNVDFDIPKELFDFMTEYDNRLTNDDWWLDMLPNTDADEFRLAHTIGFCQRDVHPSEVLGDKEWNRAKLEAHQHWFSDRFMELWNTKLIDRHLVYSIWKLNVTFLVTDISVEK